jgi:hypothetical protein
MSMLLRVVMRVWRNSDLWTRVNFEQDLCDAVEELDKLLTGLGAENSHADRLTSSSLPPMSSVKR